MSTGDVVGPEGDEFEDGIDIWVFVDVDANVVVDKGTDDEATLRGRDAVWTGGRREGQREEDMRLTRLG